MFYPALNHHCPQCAYDTSVPASASVFSELQHCSHCGTSTPGIVVQGDPSATKQEDNIMFGQQQHQQQPQEELAGLFARNMSLNPATPPPDQQGQITVPTLPEAAIASEAPQPIYTSMHYNHSRHVVPVRFHATPESTPERQLPLTDEEMILLLTQNSIDPQSLFPSQVHLLRHAGPEQRLRLLELWRISPPNVGAYDLVKEQQNWNTTRMQQEEEMARLRHQRLMLERNVTFSLMQEPQRSVSSAQSTDANRGNIFSPPERPASAPESKTYAEPYMATGYEMLARREYDSQQYTPLQESTRHNAATDPVYLGLSGMPKAGQENAENYAVLQNDDDMEL